VAQSRRRAQRWKTDEYCFTHEFFANVTSVTSLPWSRAQLAALRQAAEVGRAATVLSVSAGSSSWGDAFFAEACVVCHEQAGGSDRAKVYEVRGAAWVYQVARVVSRRASRMIKQKG
jgi:hypothetical protein